MKRRGAIGDGLGVIGKEKEEMELVEGAGLKVQGRKKGTGCRGGVSRPALPIFKILNRKFF
jgi:hypothetical protein